METFHVILLSRLFSIQKMKILFAFFSQYLHSFSSHTYYINSIQTVLFIYK